jgi:hypothetical protein
VQPPHDSGMQTSLNSGMQTSLNSGMQTSHNTLHPTSAEHAEFEEALKSAKKELLSIDRQGWLQDHPELKKAIKSYTDKVVNTLMEISTVRPDDFDDYLVGKARDIVGLARTLMEGVAKDAWFEHGKKDIYFRYPIPLLVLLKPGKYKNSKILEKQQSATYLGGKDCAGCPVLDKLTEGWDIEDKLKIWNKAHHVDDGRDDNPDSSIDYIKCACESLKDMIDIIRKREDAYVEDDIVAKSIPGGIDQNGIPWSEREHNILRQCVRMGMSSESIEKTNKLPGRTLNAIKNKRKKLNI